MKTIEKRCKTMKKPVKTRENARDFGQNYARMCWILQQQPTYLTQLSQYIHGSEAGPSKAFEGALHGMLRAI